MTDNIEDLLTEGRGWVSSVAVADHPVSAHDTIRRLTDALEALKRSRNGVLILNTELTAGLSRAEQENAELRAAISEIRTASEANTDWTVDRIITSIPEHASQEHTPGVGAGNVNSAHGDRSEAGQAAADRENAELRAVVAEVRDYANSAVYLKGVQHRLNSILSRVPETP